MSLAPGQILRSDDRRRLAGLVQQHLDASAEVRPFPAAVSQLLAACHDPTANAKDFERIIECDPALCIHLLRMANSPLFGQAREIHSVARAVSLLGLSRLKTLAMSVAGKSMFAQGSEAREQRQALWCISIGSAIVARMLSEHLPEVEPEDAFLGGIFHDVGKLLFYDAVPVEYSEFEDNPNFSAVDDEQNIFGATHEQIGLKSAHAWQLPEELKAAIGWHHRPHEAPVHASMASVLFIADHVSRAWGIGCSASEETEVVDRFFSEHKLKPDTVDALRNQAHQEYEEMLQSWTA